MKSSWVFSCVTHQPSLTLHHVRLGWWGETEISKQPIRTRYLGHVTGYQPIKDQCFLIRSVPGKILPFLLCSELIVTGWGVSSSSYASSALPSAYWLFISAPDTLALDTEHG
eukprot:sb/3477097/